MGTVVWAGKWNIPGNKYHGHRTDIRIRRPIGMAAANSKIFITLNTDKRVITIDKQSGQCSDFLSLNLPARRLVIDPSNQFLYIGLEHGLAKCNLSDASSLKTLFGSTKSGNEVGTLSTTQVEKVNGLVMLEDHILLAADTGNAR